MGNDVGASWGKDWSTAMAWERVWYLKSCLWKCFLYPTVFYKCMTLLLFSHTGHSGECRRNIAWNTVLNFNKIIISDHIKKEYWVAVMGKGLCLERNELTMVWGFREDCKRLGVWTASWRKGEDSTSGVSRNNRHTQKRSRVSYWIKAGTQQKFKGIKLIMDSRYFKA